MCYSIVRISMKDGKREYTEAKAQANENVIVKGARENPLVAKFEIFRFEAGEQKIERWESVTQTEQQKAA